jgi:hypothetical protein
MVAKLAAAKAAPPRHRELDVAIEKGNTKTLRELLKDKIRVDQRPPLKGGKRKTQRRRK